MLLVQVTLILTTSRVLAELMKRIGQPPVLGELMTGVLLGPSVLGWVWPGATTLLFPGEALQVHLLEVVAWIGMVLLLLLTGMETDVRLLRHLGRSALASSAMGMLIPFATGFALGMVTPPEFMGDPSRRILFSAFLATAMSISAMPVIAKILMDLELTKRNIGVVILSAGVVDDTTGWLILSLIAGIAGAHASGLHLALVFARTVLLTALFLASCAFVVLPFARRLFRWLDNHARSGNADVAAIVALAFLLSAVTEKIGVHAVFGAFVCGCILRQVSSVREHAVHKLEAVALSVFAPVFFGMVGLKVDLKTLGSPRMLLIVLGVATAGKLVGCTIGGLIGRMSIWESLSIGVAMNARGAMGLVVVLVGLDLGIISPEMFAIIVVMSIATSFMAPPLLHLLLPLVPIRPDEEARINAELERNVFSTDRLKVLIPTAGGPNALVAGKLATSLVRGESPSFSLLYVESAGQSLIKRLWRRLRPDQAGKNLQQHLERIKSFADARKVNVDVRRSVEPDAAAYVCKEASHGFDLILIGAGMKNPLRSGVTHGVLERAPCHVAIVRGAGDEPVDARQVLVATDGSYFSSAAVELAILYAERVSAQVTVLYSMDAERVDDDEEESDSVLAEGFRRMMATTLLTTLSPLVGRTTAKVSVLVRQSAQPTVPVIVEARTRLYQLMVIGAENRAVQHRLTVGYDVDRIMAEAPCAVLVVVPKVA
jgi:Kef-type K+ transport system membrane component KefB/nucleotide-binding universal stress UspA family protein